MLEAVSNSATIMVVEDEDDLRELFAEGLSLFGVTVIQARDGQEGWELFQANESAVDGVITDIFMPRMNGIELLNHIKEKSPSTPVMVVTGYAHRHRVELGEECISPPDAFLEKPFHFDKLMQALNDMLPEKFQV